MSEICQLLGIKKTRTTPYHPQSDGMVERFNRTLLNMLSIACNDLQGTWDVQLPFLMMVYRTSVQESTGETPFSLMFGREAKLPIDIMFGRAPDQPLPVNKYASTLRDRLETSFQCVRDRLKVQQCRQKYLYDRRARGDPYEQGALVWVHVPAVPRGKSPKLHCPWSGPYRVRKRINDVVYRVQDVNRPRRNIVVHYDRLKPCCANPQRKELSGLDSAGNDEDRQDDSDTETGDYMIISDRSRTNGATETQELNLARNSSASNEPHPPPSTPPLRRSARITRPPERYGDFVTHAVYTKSCPLERGVVLQATV